MRVLCFCEKWESGGVESFVTNLYECMDRDGIEVDVVACVRDEDALFTTRLAAIGIEVGMLSGKLWSVHENVRMFRKLLEHGHYDVVHLNLFEGLALLFARESRRSGVPCVIVHGHNTDLHPGRMRSAKLAVHHACVLLFAGQANLRWAPSEAAAHFMFGRLPWELVKNGIVPELFAFDTATRANVREKLGLGGTFVLGCVGRLCAQKNQTFLIDVLAEYASRHPGADAKLLLVGSGDDESALRAHAHMCSMDDRVVFCGARNDVPTLYSAMDVLCVPSLFEGLGIVAVEGQASGLPVLCSPAVPGEVRISDSFQSVSLDVATWVDALEALRLHGEFDRCGGGNAVRRAGYDMRETAARVRAAYETTVCEHTEGR